MDYLGEAHDLLEALSRLAVDDVRIEEPGLDEIFLSYYHASDEDGTA